MLGKLMKHEFRATARIMLPVMGAMVALALLANLSIRGLAGNLSDIPMLRILFVLIIIFFSVAVVATIVMSLVIMVSRFYRNLLKDEGYLMFTLPVSVHELIWSKLIVSLVWFLATALLIFLVMSLMALNLSHTNLEMILEQLPSWSEINRWLDETGIRGQLVTLLIQAVLGTLIGIFAACLHFYAAMSLGHMFSKDKVLLSIVFFVGISFAFNMMEMGYGVIGFGLFDSKMMQMEESADTLRFVSTMIWHGIILSAVQSAVLYLATWLGLKKGLNLE
ncbi:MAG: hypothetical protein IKO00_13230 [Oscillospiraceae bacterium]|nr:hypothetical protein [Oscillospiraceae bacterium]